MPRKNAVQATSGHKEMSLREAIALFLAQHRPSSAASYGANLKIIADLIGPAREIAAIDHRHILDVQLFLNDPKRAYAPATKTKYIKTLKTFFNWLVKNAFLMESPASFLKVPRVNLYIDPEKAMTDDELTKLLDYVKWRPRDLALVLFLADTGARAGGAAGLRWKDINFEEMRASVTEKGDKTRPVAFGELCTEALKRWQARRPKGAGEYVFSPNVTPMISAAISQVVTRACVAAGIRSLGSHSLRHRKGHQFADNRIAPTTAALAMGHSDVSVTLETYYPRGWARTDEALRALAVKSITSPGTQPPTRGDEPEKRPDAKLIVLKRPS